MRWIVAIGALAWCSACLTVEGDAAACSSSSDCPVDHDCEAGVCVAAACVSVPWYFDADGDGVGAGAAELACEGQDSSWVVEGGDCYDDDPSFVGPPPEVCGYRLDDACETNRDDCAWGDADVSFANVEDRFRNFGQVYAIGDFDGDGDRDLVVRYLDTNSDDPSSTGVSAIGFFWGPFARASTEHVTADLLVEGPPGSETFGSRLVNLGPLVERGADALGLVFATSGPIAPPTDMRRLAGLIALGGDRTSFAGLGRTFAEPTLQLPGIVRLLTSRSSIVLARAGPAVGGDASTPRLAIAEAKYSEVAEEKRLWLFPMLAEGVTELDLTGSQPTAIRFTLQQPDGEVAVLATEDLDGDDVLDLAVGCVAETQLAYQRGSIFVAPGPFPPAGAPDRRVEPAVSEGPGAERGERLGERLAFRKTGGRNELWASARMHSVSVGDVAVKTVGGVRTYSVGPGGSLEELSFLRGNDGSSQLAYSMDTNAEGGVLIVPALETEIDGAETGAAILSPSWITTGETIFDRSLPLVTFDTGMQTGSFEDLDGDGREDVALAQYGGRGRLRFYLGAAHRF